MIDNLGDGMYSVTCDKCADERTYVVVDGWWELLGEMKSDGWKNRKVDGEWQHICDNCQHPEG